MNSPDFEVRKRVFRHSPLENTKNPEFCENFRKIYFRPLLGLQNAPRFSVFGTFFRLLAAKKRKIPDISGQNAGTNSGKLGFYRFYCFRGRSWSPRGRFRSLRGSISQAPGPDFGAILHKPGQKVRKVRIPKNGMDFPWFHDEIPPFSLL